MVFKGDVANHNVLTVEKAAAIHRAALDLEDDIGPVIRADLGKGQAGHIGVEIENLASPVLVDFGEGLETYSGCVVGGEGECDVQITIERCRLSVSCDQPRGLESRNDRFAIVGCGPDQARVPPSNVGEEHWSKLQTIGLVLAHADIGVAIIKKIQALDA